MEIRLSQEAREKLQRSGKQVSDLQGRYGDQRKGSLKQRKGGRTVAPGKKGDPLQELPEALEE